MGNSAQQYFYQMDRVLFNAMREIQVHNSKVKSNSSWKKNKHVEEKGKEAIVSTTREQTMSQRALKQIISQRKEQRRQSSYVEEYHRCINM